MIRNERIRGQRKRRKSQKNTSEKDVEAVWACDARREALSRIKGG